MLMNGESLVEEFADTRGSEKKEPQNHIFLPRRSNQLSVAAPISGVSVHEGELILFKEAH